MKKTQIPAQCSDLRLFCMVTSIFVCLIVNESIALSLDIVLVKKNHFGWEKQWSSVFRVRSSTKSNFYLVKLKDYVEQLFT